MLAYVFWHRPAGGVGMEDYERGAVAFHRSLARRPPDGLRSSCTLRAPDLPWLGPGGAGYEDWYLLDSWSAVGVLEEAATGRGHRSAHDAMARSMGEGTGAIMRRVEGEREPGEARLATWIDPGPRPAVPELADLLADGTAPGEATLWRRVLALGPAPELCLLAAERPPGASAGRLPAGWSAAATAREALPGG